MKTRRIGNSFLPVKQGKIHLSATSVYVEYKEWVRNFSGTSAGFPLDYVPPAGWCVVCLGEVEPVAVIQGINISAFIPPK